MKETKVYVDEMPNSCSKCEWCTLNHKDNYGRSFCLISRMPLYNGDKVNEERGQYKDSLSDFNCPLIDIKTHDRELVKEVCEKIKTFVRENTYICGGNATREDIITSSSYNQALRDVLDFLGTLQKEFEDE